MAQPSFDPGLTQKFTGDIRRIINKDGTFNVQRKSGRAGDLNPYQYLINVSWPRFFALSLSAYFVINVIFAAIYLAFGIEHLKGADTPSPAADFTSAFFFSVHTLTTVGYGNVVPQGFWVNLVAALEAMAGLMSFAVGTGLLYGRFSRPTARLVFSEKALIAPYQDGKSLQFRVANRRTNMLMELEAAVLLMTVEHSQDGQPLRKYAILELERKNVYFLPITWTVVHPIREGSPFWNRTPQELAELRSELLILIKGFDDTFGQVVHARYSYRFDEIVWDARFLPAFHIGDEGDVIVEMDRVGQHEPVAQS